MATTKIKEEAKENPVSKEAVKEVIEQIIESKGNSNTLIYVGPSVKGLGQHALFTGGYPSHIKHHLEDFKELKSLFIAPEILTEFTNAKKTEGTFENLVYKKAENYFSGVK